MGIDHRRLRCAAPVVLVVFSTACAPRSPTVVLESEDGKLKELAWMSGSWVSEGEGKRSEEHWTPAAGATMLGVNRSTAGDRTLFFEYLRIEGRPDGVVYVASPRGKNETEFRLTESSDGRAVFENPDHDFPQRIIYWRSPEAMLHARIEGRQGPKFVSSEWHWKAATIVRRD